LFPSTMVIRRECFDEFGGFDEEMLACEDVELFGRICSRWKAAWVNTPLVVRYEGVHNITANRNKMSQYTILALRKILCKEPGLPASTRKVLLEELGRQHWWRGYEAFEQGDSIQARRCFVEAVRCDPSHLRHSSVLIAASFLPVSVRNFLRRMKRNARFEPLTH